MGVKKSFTLIELLIVLVLVSVSYFLIFSNSNFKINENTQKLQLDNIQSFLKSNFIFDQEIVFLCIEKEFECFVKIDNVLEERPIVKNFFKEKPSVYEYSKEQIQIEFGRMNINNVNEELIFELKLNSDYKIDEFVLDTNHDKVYIFNSIFTKPQIVDSLNDVLDIFDNNEQEVRNAF